MGPRLIGPLVALLLIIAACGSNGRDDSGTDSSADDPALDDFIADNGYADVTLGRTIEELRRSYGRSSFIESDYGPDVAEAYTIDGLPQLQLLFVEGVLTQVDVTDPGLASINGLHEVGDPRAEVITSYQDRIESGEDLAITCAADNISVRARSPYRLVFFTDHDTVTRISAMRSEHIVPGEPCGEIDDVDPVEEYIDASDESADEDDFETTEPPTVADVLPEEIDGAKILRNPNTDDLSDEYAFLWWTAAHRFTALGVVGYADSIISCLYRSDPPAFAVGLYLDGPVRLVVAVAPAAIPSLQNLGCGVKEIVKDFLCPNCLISQPAGGGYVVEVEGQTFAVAYVTMGGVQDKERMCGVLPYCGRTDFAPVPTISS